MTTHDTRLTRRRFRGYHGTQRFAIGSAAVAYAADNGATGFIGRVEASTPQRGVLLVDRRHTYPRGAWFAPDEVRRVVRAEERN